MQLASNRQWPSKPVRIGSPVTESTAIGDGVAIISQPNEPCFPARRELHTLFQLLFLFCVVPFVELWLLLAVAERTSALATLALVIFTGIVGAGLARQQGFSVLQKLQSEMAANRVPTTALADGAMILVAGALLLTPGILTDAFGFSLLVPPIRVLYRKNTDALLQESDSIHDRGQPCGLATTTDERPNHRRGSRRKSPGQ